MSESENLNTENSTNNDRVEEVRQAVLSSSKSIADKVIPLLKNPKQEWPVIKAREESVSEFYRSYLAILIAIGPVSIFVANAIVLRRPFFATLEFALLMYLVGLAIPYIMAILCEKIAPLCDGEVSRAEGVRLVGYALTASYVASVFQIIPALAIIASLVSIYSLYLFYTGTPVMTTVPRGQVAKFIAILVVAWVLIWVLVGGILTGLFFGFSSVV